MTPPTNPEQWYFNIYEIGRAYGGPEEGGWYYDYGKPIESVPLKSHPFVLDANGEEMRDDTGAYMKSEEVQGMINFFESKGFDFVNNKSGGNRFKTSPWDADEEDFQNAKRNNIGDPEGAAAEYQEGSSFMEDFGREYPELLDKWYMDQYTDYAYHIENRPAEAYPAEKPYYE